MNELFLTGAENCQVGGVDALGRSDRSPWLTIASFYPSHGLKIMIVVQRLEYLSKTVFIAVRANWVKQAHKRGMSFKRFGGDEVYGNAHVWIEQPVFRVENAGTGRPRTHATLSDDSSGSVNVCS